MGWLSRLFGGKSEENEPIELRDLDTPAVRERLGDLEVALADLYRGMSQEACPLNNPGWQGKLRDYAWVRGEVAQMTEGSITHDGIYDLLLSVRPVFPRDVPEDLSFLAPLQRRVLDAADALRSAIG